MLLPQPGPMASHAWGRWVPTFQPSGHVAFGPCFWGSGFKPCQEPGVSMLSLLPWPLQKPSI